MLRVKSEALTGLRSASTKASSAAWSTRQPGRRFRCCIDRRLPRCCSRPITDPFLRALAHALRGEAEIGDGLVVRQCRELQRQFFKAPLVTMPHAPWHTTKLRSLPPILTSAWRSDRGENSITPKSF